MLPIDAQIIQNIKFFEGLFRDCASQRKTKEKGKQNCAICERDRHAKPIRH